MTIIDEVGRPEPPLAADEIGTLLGFLTFRRATLAWKCRGIDEAGARVTVGVSSLTLGGLLKHLAYVEDEWSAHWLAGGDRQPPWSTVDWADDGDWEFRSAADDPVVELFALWERSVTRAQAILDEAIATGGLDQLARRPWPDGSAPSLRWILVHLIEEYARHNGHADLLREAVDGQTGE